MEANRKKKSVVIEQVDKLPYVVCLVGSTKPKWKKRYRQVEEEVYSR